MYDTFTIANT